MPLLTPLFTLTDAELAYGDVPLLDCASFALEAGERVGLIGRNGTGKSSLLGIIAGRVALDDGELKKNDGLRIAYVEQEPVVSGDPAVPKHKLEEFLHRFNLNPAIKPENMSGGERKRAALALAFAQEPDLLLLDEPTNHLDVDGILTLEGLVLKQNSAIIITHDRAFLDNVVTQTIAAEGGGKWQEYAGGYSDWLRQRPPKEDVEKGFLRKDFSVREKKGQSKLSYRESRELEALPKEIAALEAEQQALSAKMHAPEYYQQAPEALREDQRRNSEIEALLHEKLERWEMLELRL